MTSTNSNCNSNTTSNSIIEAEYNEIESKGRNAWHITYQDIREKSEKEAKEKHFYTIESEKSQNRGLNRYRDVNPYDHSRIVLHRGKVDYINANLVKLERADRKYILTQGPLGDTVGHFWLMIWEQKTKAILMLNKLLEKKQIKCHQYWPDKKGADNAMKLIEVGLAVEYLRCEEYKNFSRRWFRLTDLESMQSREIIQFHYTNWPDFGIPSSPVAFLQFLKQVRDSGALEPDVGPAVVHCSAGIGRSGTFCLVDCCLVLIDKEGEDKVSVRDVLFEMRRYRMGLIQTADQLYFSYQAIIEGVKLLKDPSFMDYDEIPNIPKDEPLDETPPPLPRRTHSLPIGNGGAAIVNSKPLPTIPSSESCIEGFADFKNKDAINNFINSEKNSLESSTNADKAAPTTNTIDHRPLPPIPKQQQKSPDDCESQSDDDNDISEINDDDSDDDAGGNDNKDYEKLTNDMNKQSRDKSTSNLIDDNNQQLAKSNGIEMSSPSFENELKRRKRAERQANIEQKVNDIKRKQREVKESEETAKKRRLIKKMKNKQK
ncbi:tyrosine-protein phosphatase non-receptor type 61F isoform X2 [Episyrphus balteatus]|uniref:tyrosine-protein phosphatase non-receptor type 61F isoform X2 n=1 Tax=Episyrphus balteatus TaxID=286459 RepID=UPI0024857C12|nr:tyrosine-protein phosphatase non-receptor type 61F isoform X2 [Episyrphus balteatus]